MVTCRCKASTTTFRSRHHQASCPTFVFRNIIGHQDLLRLRYIDVQLSRNNRRAISLQIKVLAISGRVDKKLMFVLVTLTLCLHDWIDYLSAIAILALGEWTATICLYSYLRITLVHRYSPKRAKTGYILLYGLDTTSTGIMVTRRSSHLHTADTRYELLRSATLVATNYNFCFLLTVMRHCGAWKIRAGASGSGTGEGFGFLFLVPFIVFIPGCPWTPFSLS